MGEALQLLTPKEPIPTFVDILSIVSVNLLNITLLYNHGFKISKIANLEEEEIPILVRDIALKSNSEQVSINAFKLSMVNFDTVLV